MTRNNKLIAGAAVLAAGVATYFIARGRKPKALMSGPDSTQPHTRHVTGVFARAKSNQLAHSSNQ